MEIVDTRTTRDGSYYIAKIGKNYFLRQTGTFTVYEYGEIMEGRKKRDRRKYEYRKYDDRLVWTFGVSALDKATEMMETRAAAHNAKGN